MDIGTTIKLMAQCWLKNSVCCTEPQRAIEEKAVMCANSTQKHFMLTSTLLSSFSSFNISSRLSGLDKIHFDKNAMENCKTQCQNKRWAKLTKIFTYVGLPLRQPLLPPLLLPPR